MKRLFSWRRFSGEDSHAGNVEGRYVTSFTLPVTMTEGVPFEDLEKTLRTNHSGKNLFRKLYLY